MQISANMTFIRSAGSSKRLILPVALFLIGLLSLPFAQMSRLSMMSGDVGDARLNNYFLENVYQFFAGNSDCFGISAFSGLSRMFWVFRTNYSGRRLST